MAPSRAELERVLSADRLAPYLRTAGEDFDRAIGLYCWNTDVAAALFEMLSDVEIVLRNAMYRELARLTTDPELSQPWHVSFTHLVDRRGRRVLHQRAIEDLEKARWRAGRDGGRVNDGRVVAELSLGFWKFLLTRRYEHSLWTPQLRHAFSTNRRADVHDTVDQLHRLRNRIAHHEPIYRRDLNADFTACPQLIGWVSPAVRDWVADGSRVPRVIAEKP